MQGPADQPAADPPAQLALSPSNPQMAQGTAQQFDVRALYADGSTRDVTSQVKWTVTDERGQNSPMPADGHLALERPGRYVITADYHGSALTTMLLVTHEMGFARQVSSEVVFLHQGLVEEQGSPQQVFENPLSARCKQFMSSNR
jgi:hypothetical protein